MSAVTLHRADLVFPITSPPLQDGAVAVEDHTILAVGPFSSLQERFQGAPIRDHKQSALLPALVNAHIHLELSHLSIPRYHPHVSGFTDWIRLLLAGRAEQADVGPGVEEAALATLREQHDQGVLLLGDIGNTDLGARIAAGFPGYILHFNEVLGRSAGTRRAIFSRVEQAGPETMFTAHAPYSTHPEVITTLKKRAARLGHPFPIHVAEPPSEKDLLTRGSGELFDFLRERKFIDEGWLPPGTIDMAGSVEYLHGLGVLDSRTLCVHCVHVTEDEARLLAAARTKICLCPGSNRYLRVGKPPVPLYLHEGILPALGTDSRASNPELSLWREMRLLAEDQPELSPHDILAMATLGGARALGMEERCGSLAPGRSARFLAVPLRGGEDVPAALQRLVHDNRELLPSWVSEQ